MSWHLKLVQTNETLKLTAETTDNTSIKADSTITLSLKDFMKLLVGDLNSTTAFMFAKLKVDGSIGLVLKLEGMLKEYKF